MANRLDAVYRQLDRETAANTAPDDGVPPLGEPLTNGHASPSEIPRRIELRQFTVAEIRSEIEPEQLLLPGVPAEAYTLIAGALSSYKTTLLMYLLIWKATGFDLLDLDPNGSGVELGKSVFLTYEDTLKRVKKKFQTIMQHSERRVLQQHGQREADRFVELAAAHFAILPLAGGIGYGIVRRFDTGIILPNHEFLEAFYMQLRQFSPEGATVGLDPLRLSIVGSQNDDDGADVVVHTLNQMATAVAGSGIIAASHTTKSGAKEQTAGYAAAAYATSGSALYSQHARSNFHLGRLPSAEIRTLFAPVDVTAAQADKEMVSRLTHGRLSHGTEQDDRYLLMDGGALVAVRPQTTKGPKEQMHADARHVIAAIDRIKTDDMRVSMVALESDDVLLREIGSRAEIRTAVTLLTENSYVEQTGTTRNRDIVVTPAGRALVSGENRREIKK